MTNAQVSQSLDKAKRIAEDHVALSAKGLSLSEELHAIRQELATPKGAKKAQAAYASERLPSPRRLGPPRQVVLPAVATPDRAEMDRLMKEASENFRAVQRAKQNREHRMIETMEAMRVALVEAGKRETEALDRVKASEKHSAFMVKLTMLSVVLTALAIVVPVVVAVSIN